MKKIITFFILTLSFLFGGIVLVLFFAPWKEPLARQIMARLQAQGVNVTALELESINTEKIILRRMTLGRITLEHLAIDYTLAELWQGRVGALALQDLDVGLAYENGAWNWDGIAASNEQQQKSKIFIPDTQEAINSIAVRQATLENARFALDAGTWQMSFPLQGEWDRDAPRLRYEAQNISLHHPSLKMDTGALSGALDFADGIWRGEWRLLAISIPDYPQMQAEGTLEIAQRTLGLKAKLQAEDGAGDAHIQITYPFDAPEKMTVELTRGEMAWGGGKIKIGKSIIPFDGKTNLRAVIDVQNVSVREVLSTLSGQEVEATGTISGSVPVIITPKGQLSLEKGRMAANQNGVLSLPSDMIPGAGDQIDMTREILSHFEYDGLSIAVEEQEKGGIVIVLGLSGNNPKVYDGRAVKLNVRLGGDVLEFLQSNLMMLGDPRNFLKSGE